VSEKLIIERFTFPEIEEVNTFIIASLPLGEGMIIDAGGFDEKMFEFIAMNNLVIKYLLITHSHDDHISAYDTVLESYEDIITYAGEKIEGADVKIPDEGENIYLGNMMGTIHKVPGHTNDGMVFFINGNLFTGDNLFAGSVGGITSHQNYKLLLRNLHKVLGDYRNSTVIHPAHGPSSTIELERMFNPFLNEFNL
jgi:hydroxyacylglutathione hydrolase